MSISSNSDVLKAFSVVEKTEKILIYIYSSLASNCLNYLKAAQIASVTLSCGRTSFSQNGHGHSKFILNVNLNLRSAKIYTQCVNKTTS